MRNKELSASLYKKILASMPVVCVDLVIVHRGKFLLVKRTNSPARGRWWLVGGRIKKGEYVYRAAARKAKEEVGLRIAVGRILGVRDTMFPTSAFGVPTHTVNVVYFARALSLRGLRVDFQSSELRWFSKIDHTWPKYVREILTLAGFRK